MKSLGAVFIALIALMVVSGCSGLATNKDVPDPNQNDEFQNDIFVLDSDADDESDITEEEFVSDGDSSFEESRDFSDVVLEGDIPARFYFREDINVALTASGGSGSYTCEKRNFPDWMDCIVSGDQIKLVGTVETELSRRPVIKVCDTADSSNCETKRFSINVVRIIPAGPERFASINSCFLPLKIEVVDVKISDRRGDERLLENDFGNNDVNKIKSYYGDHFEATFKVKNGDPSRTYNWSYVSVAERTLYPDRGTVLWTASESDGMYKISGTFKKGVVACHNSEEDIDYVLGGIGEHHPSYSEANCGDREKVILEKLTVIAADTSCPARSPAWKEFDLRFFFHSAALKTVELKHAVYDYNNDTYFQIILFDDEDKKISCTEPRRPNMPRHWDTPLELELDDQNCREMLVVDSANPIRSDGEFMSDRGFTRLEKIKKISIVLHDDVCESGGVLPDDFFAVEVGKMCVKGQGIRFCKQYSPDGILGRYWYNETSCQRSFDFTTDAKWEIVSPE